jgi:predicted neutral ceramidase superfamily lipid hydrolase
MSKTINEIRKWCDVNLTRHRDAFIYLLFTTIFSILPIITGYFMLKAFGKWTGNWSKLLESGDLLIASTSLMATSVYIFLKKDLRRSFLKSASSLLAVLIIVFSSLFYGALALSAQGIIPPENRMLPDAIVDISVGIYAIALLVGFYAFYSEQVRPPSSLVIRDQQVSALESALENLGGNQ